MNSSISKEDDLVGQIIQMSIMNQYVYSKVQFDNASDTSKLITIAQENQRLLETVTKSRIAPYVDRLLERKLREIIGDSNGKVSIVLGDGKFTAIKIEEE